MNILISAGEASGDLYAARLAERLTQSLPGATFFGCAGPRMRAAGVETIVDAPSLAVAGLVEVVSHLPRIRREFHRIVSAAEQRRPRVAILTDSPDFHLRLAKRLNALRIPVIQFVAPQVWAWRPGRLRSLRRNLDGLLCIFPFEEAFFRSEQVPAHYIGHPLAGLVKPDLSREEFFRKHQIPGGRPLIGLLPGSRRGEILRHLGPLSDAVRLINNRMPASFAAAVPAGFAQRADVAASTGRAFPVIEGESWNLLAHSDLALAASGTVTIEGALLGTPMVTYYRVAGLSWLLGKVMVRVPFYTMVNLVAGRQVVPELMQSAMTAERLAGEAVALFEDPARLARMREGLHEVARVLAGDEDPMDRAAAIVEQVITRK